MEVNAQDILSVMKMLGFDNYNFILKAYYNSYLNAHNKLQQEVEYSMKNLKGRK